MKKKLIKTIATFVLLLHGLIIFAQATSNNPSKNRETGIRFEYLYGQSDIQKSRANPISQLGGFGPVSGFDIAYFIHKPVHRLLTLKFSTGLYLHGRQYEDAKYRHLIPYISPGIRIPLLKPLYFDADLRTGFLLAINDFQRPSFNKFDFSSYLGLYMPINQRIGLQCGFQKSFIPYSKTEFPDITFSVFRKSWHVGAAVKF